MIVYEVNLSIDAAVYDAYRVWLDAHIAEILTLDGFLQATVWEVREPPASPTLRALCVHYRLRDRAALEDYFAHHAPRLREEGQRRFGGRFSATRRVLARVDAP
jgi:hypothetical protein